MHPTEQQLHQEAVHKIFALTERDAPEPQDEAGENGSFVNGLNNFLLIFQNVTGLKAVLKVTA